MPDDQPQNPPAQPPPREEPKQPEPEWDWEKKERKPGGQTR